MLPLSNESLKFLHRSLLVLHVYAFVNAVAWTPQPIELGFHSSEFHLSSIVRCLLHVFVLVNNLILTPSYLIASFFLTNLRFWSILLWSLHFLASVIYIGECLDHNGDGDFSFWCLLLTMWYFVIITLLFIYVTCIHLSALNCIDVHLILHALVKYDLFAVADWSSSVLLVPGDAPIQCCRSIREAEGTH